MALTSAMRDADAAVAIETAGQTLTWNGTSYACAADTDRDGRQGQLEGDWEDIAVALTVRTALFTGTRPGPGNSITYRGTTYRVAYVERRADDVSITLNCVER